MVLADGTNEAYVLTQKAIDKWGLDTKEKKKC